MIYTVTQTSSASSSFVQPVIIAAAVAAIVSLLTHWAAGRRDERSRRRELLAEAYQACIAYKEFPYRIRRRRADRLEDERARLVNDLNEIQERLAFFEAWTSLEGRGVRESFSSLLRSLRIIAGPEISKAWEISPIENDRQVSIKDVDLSQLEVFEKAFLTAVRRRTGSFIDRIALILHERSSSKP